MTEPLSLNALLDLVVCEAWVIAELPEEERGGMRVPYYDELSLRLQIITGSAAGRSLGSE
jgi:hypothetical protein